MFALTFVRHGESTDNLKHIWAGWKDAELSVHGFNQAKASGAFHANTKIHTIFSSTLKRAHTTALQILEYQPEPKPQFILTPLLREQHWGIAEGQPFSFKPISSSENDSPTRSPLEDRTSKFPEGESVNDVAARGEMFIDEFIVPLMKGILNSKSSLEDGSQSPIHIYVVSHGIAIAELIGAFLRRDNRGGVVESETWRGLRNTGWTRLFVTLDPAEAVSPVTATVVDVAETEQDVGSLLTTLNEGANPPPTNSNMSTNPNMVVRVTDVNQHSHLDNVKRQKSIGSSTYDPNQKSIRDFFGGGGRLAKS